MIVNHGVKLGTWRTWRTWIGSFIRDPSQMMASVAPGCTFNCVKESKVATWRVNGGVVIHWKIAGITWNYIN
jgi:hypothetical protein